MKLFSRHIGASLTGLVLLVAFITTHRNVHASDMNSNTQIVSAGTQPVNYQSPTAIFFKIDQDLDGDRVVMICKLPVVQVNASTTPIFDSSQERCETLTLGGLGPEQVYRAKSALAWQIRLEKFAQPQDMEKIRAIHLAYFVLCETGARYVFIDAGQTRAVVDSILKAIN